MLGLREDFAFDLSEVEPAIVAHKIDDSIKLLVYEASFVADYCYRDNRAGLAVLMVDLGD